jgi:hypothetical protein
MTQRVTFQLVVYPRVDFGLETLHSNARLVHNRRIALNGLGSFTAQATSEEPAFLGQRTIDSSYQFSNANTLALPSNDMARISYRDIGVVVVTVNLLISNNVEELWMQRPTIDQKHQLRHFRANKTDTHCYSKDQYTTGAHYRSGENFRAIEFAMSR